MSSVLSKLGLKYLEPFEREWQVDRRIFIPKERSRLDMHNFKMLSVGSI